jgi:hypothetical protein
VYPVSSKNGERGRERKRGKKKKKKKENERYDMTEKSL